jgi:two-component system cell cycle response regulator DivK
MNNTISIDRQSNDARSRAIEPNEAHVLIVEDHMPDFVMMARMLALIGVQYYEWKTTRWQLSQSVDTLPQIDLILMDIWRPNENGYQALAKICVNPRLDATRVVAMTSNASEAHMLRARQAGFDGFLGKPFDLDRLPHQLRSILSGEAVWDWR